MKILLIGIGERPGPDMRLRSALQSAFGTEPHTALDAEDGLSILRHDQYDVMLLNGSLRCGGRGAGWAVAAIRRVTDAPVLILASDGSDAAALLDAGADDHVVRPVPIGELIARVRAIARRASGRASSRFFGDLELDMIVRDARMGGRSLALSPGQYWLLESLANSRRPLSIREFGSESGSPLSKTSIAGYVMALRRKLEAAGSQVTIANIPFRGYYLHLPSLLGKAA